MLIYYVVKYYYSILCKTYQFVHAVKAQKIPKLRACSILELYWGLLDSKVIQVDKSSKKLH